MVRSSLAEQAYLRLRDAILCGQIPPQRPLSETDLTGMLNVSRTPVREALLRLELEGYLTRDGTKRLSVRVPSVEEIIEDFWLRELLEVHAARLATSRISEEELARLNELVAADQAALRARTVNGLASKNEDIHSLILRASRNRALVRLVQGLHAKVRGIQAFSVGTMEDQEEFVAHHADLHTALAEGDGPRAMEVTRRHLHKARDLLLTALDPAGTWRERMAEAELPPSATIVAQYLEILSGVTSGVDSGAATALDRHMLPHEEEQP
jgi:DNA-binding GntR family transcriptional regulator